jgi:hypothetical protein
MVETTGRTTGISYILRITTRTGNGKREKFHISVRCPLSAVFWFLTRILNWMRRGLRYQDKEDDHDRVIC